MKILELAKANSFVNWACGVIRSLDLCQSTRALHVSHLDTVCTHRTCQVKCDRFCLKLKCVFWCLPNTTSILFCSSSHVAKDWYFVSKVSVINSKRPIGGVYSVLRGGTLVWSSTNSLVNFVWPFPKSFEHLGAAEETLRPTLLRTLGGYKSLDLESYNWVLQMPRGFLHRSVLQIASMLSEQILFYQPQSGGTRGWRGILHSADSTNMISKGQMLRIRLNLT